MTNTLALIITAVLTNFSLYRGTFIDTNGARWNVMQAVVTTNTSVHAEHEGQTLLFTLKSVPGPVLAQYKLTPWLGNTNAAPPFDPATFLPNPPQHAVSSSSTNQP